MREAFTSDRLIFWGLLAGAGGAIMLLVCSIVTDLRIVGALLLLVGWAMLGILAVGSRRCLSELRGIRAELKIHDERQLDRTRRIEAAIETERAKESRHEYVQEQALERIESRLREAAAGPGARRAFSGFQRKRDVLFVTSNGAGLGHLTRLLAVADRMGSGYDVEFLTLSRAYRQVEGWGYPVRYFPSAEAIDWGTRLWNTTFRTYLQDVFAESAPKVVVFDGTVVYQGLVDVCRGHDTPLIWMQRGCWKPEAEHRYPTRRAAARVADHVIIPGDYACEEEVDVGSGVDVSQVGPIVLTRKDWMLTGEEARAELGLSPRSWHILFNLGGGNLSDPETYLNVLRKVVDTSLESFEISMLLSPLSPHQEMPPEINVIRKYPIARFARAFDFVISAAGYNSVQEAAGLRIPTILVPNEATRTDDQVRRAEAAGAQGWALVARSAEDVGIQARRLASDPSVSEKIQKALCGLEAPAGASEASRVVRRAVNSAHWVRETDAIGNLTE